MLSVYVPTQDGSHRVVGESTFLVDRQLTKAWDAFTEYAGDFPHAGGPRHLLHAGTKPFRRTWRARLMRNSGLGTISCGGAGEKVKLSTNCLQFHRRAVVSVKPEVIPGRSGNLEKIRESQIQLDATVTVIDVEVIDSGFQTFTVSWSPATSGHIPFW